jgi:hypothetical protein
VTVNRVVAAAEWALMTKNQGDTADYSVLFGSSPGLASRVRVGVPSTPELGSTPGPGRLPWATFTPRYPEADSASQPRIAVTAIDETSDRDAIGRPVMQFRYVELCFADIAAAGAGYAELYLAIPARSALSDRKLDSEKLTLELPGPDRSITRSLAAPGCFDRAAGLAALLLCGDVLLTLNERPGRDSLSLEARLAEFDRVLALLPFGMRASVSLGSWDDGTQTASFRLGFGKFAAMGQFVARHGTPVPPPADDRAASYLQFLYRLRDRFGIESLVAHLARFRAPLHADDADYATGILSALDDPMAVVHAVLNGRPAVELVANTWRYARDRLDERACDELEAYLLNQPGEEAERAAQDGWSDRSPRIAARVGLGALQAGRGSQLRRLHSHAAARGDSDCFLATLAAGETHRGGTVAARIVAAELRSLAVPRQGELPALRLAAHRRPDLARWLLRLSVDRDADPGTWVEWLDPAATDAPGWLAGYAVLAAAPGLPVPVPPGAPEAEDLALLAWLAVRDTSFAVLDEGWWPSLFRVARIRAASLTGEPPGEPEADQACADLASLLGQAEARNRSAGDLLVDVLVDTLRLYLGMKPVSYPLDLGAVPCRAYLGALWDAWSRPPAATDTSALAVWLIDGVFGPESKGHPLANPHGEATITLLCEVVTDDRIPLSDPVARSIGRVIDAFPSLADEPRLTPEWWARIDQVLPGLRTPQSRLRAAVQHAGREPVASDRVEIALLSAAAAADSSAQEVAAVIRSWFSEQPVAVRSSMFRIVEGALRLAGVESGRSYDDYLAALASELGLAEERQGGLRRRRNTLS